MESLIDHGLAVYKTWSARYPDVTGHIKIIRDSLLRGLEIRVQQLEFWAAYFKAGYLPTFQASRFVLKDVDNPNKGNANSNSPYKII